MLLIVHGASTNGWSPRLGQQGKTTTVVGLLAGATPPTQFAPVLQLLSGPRPLQVCAEAAPGRRKAKTAVINAHEMRAATCSRRSRKSAARAMCTDGTHTEAHQNCAQQQHSPFRQRRNGGGSNGEGCKGH